RTAVCISTSTTTPTTRRSCWCSRPSPCSCSCTFCSRRSCPIRRTKPRPAMRISGHRRISKRSNDKSGPQQTRERPSMPSKILDERTFAHTGNKPCSFRADDVAASHEFRRSYEQRPNVVLAEDMPYEHSADGLIKHLVHNKLNTRECCVEAYMQFLKPGER